MGYEEAGLYYAGEMTEEQAVQQIIKRQWAYARRQRTWFKKESWWRIYNAESPHLYEEVLADLNQAT